MPVHSRILQFLPCEYPASGNALCQSDLAARCAGFEGKPLSQELCLKCTIRVYPESCKGQAGSVAQPGVKPGLPTTVGRDAGFYSHLLMCGLVWILMREDISG